VLAAADPANPYGAALDWPDRAEPAAGHRPGRKAGALVVLVDGRPALYVERGGRSLLTFADADDADVLRRAADSLPGDVSVTTLLVEGSPARALVQRACSEEYDLIVMGSHGHGRLHGALLGCVSQKVLHASPVPVLLARAPREEPAPAPAPARPVVAAHVP
jgi:nucleotide-binding universal stress UspA family protein